jgi:hypothetical protein
VCDPVLVEQAADMLAPCGAGRRERGTCGQQGRVRGSRTRSNCDEESENWND